MLLNKQTTEYRCDHCGDLVESSLVVLSGFHQYNSLYCTNCIDHNEDDEEDDYDQSYDN